MVNLKRVRNLKSGIPGNGPVVYWMSRDQRVHDNWALLYAIECAQNTERSVVVLFALAEGFLGATWRQYDFLIRGLKGVELHLSTLNIHFALLIGNPEITIQAYLQKIHAAQLVTDFDPLRIKKEWKANIIRNVTIQVDEVDAHNIVPCWLASDKEEFGAYTFRPKINKLLPEFLDDFPPLVRQPGPAQHPAIAWKTVISALHVDNSVKPIDWIAPGETGGKIALGHFLGTWLTGYASKRNDPSEPHTSRLSPYLHFGHLSAQRVALEVTSNLKSNDDTAAFLEELIVRRELSDNYCQYNPNYDDVNGFRSWARASLSRHLSDPRMNLYTPEQFERALTHDELWNAAQMQLVNTGSMHGYMRMYWAKKILEWSVNPSEALATAIFLNDRYQLDGRDPNGYTGCAWSIGGVHDRPWVDRPVFGQIRYMNRNGCERKFDTKKYIRSHLHGAQES